VSRHPQFPEHLFGVDQTAAFNVFLGVKECVMEQGPVIRGKPVTRIERQKLDLCSLGQVRGLFHYESTIMNPGLERHAGRIP